jgi:hypothetical protein
MQAPQRRKRQFGNIGTLTMRGDMANSGYYPKGCADGNNQPVVGNMDMRKIKIRSKEDWKNVVATHGNAVALRVGLNRAMSMVKSANPAFGLFSPFPKRRPDVEGMNYPLWQDASKPVQTVGGYTYSPTPGAIPWKHKAYFNLEFIVAKESKQKPTGPDFKQYMRGVNLIRASMEIMNHIANLMAELTQQNKGNMKAVLEGFQSQGVLSDRDITIINDLSIATEGFGELLASEPLSDNELRLYNEGTDELIIQSFNSILDWFVDYPVGKQRVKAMNDVRVTIISQRGTNEGAEKLIDDTVRRAVEMVNKRITNGELELNKDNISQEELSAAPDKQSMSTDDALELMVFNADLNNVSAEDIANAVKDLPVSDASDNERRATSEGDDSSPGNVDGAPEVDEVGELEAVVFDESDNDDQDAEGVELMKAELLKEPDLSKGEEELLDRTVYEEAPTQPVPTIEEENDQYFEEIIDDLGDSDSDDESG